jgi:predicted GIY-YIG superfamily endonuclease
LCILLILSLFIIICLKGSRSVFYDEITFTGFKILEIVDNNIKELVSLFNIQNKYNSFGCYRFLDHESKTIYIGTSKNIHRRLFSQHFKKGHLPKECYNSTCKVEIIKTKDYPSALALEIYLIDKYRPKYNKKDKSKDLFNQTKFDNGDYYKKLEKWQLYYTFKEFDFNKVEISNRQNKLALIATIMFFICVLAYTLNGFL